MTGRAPKAASQRLWTRFWDRVVRSARLHYFFLAQHDAPKVRDKLGPEVPKSVHRRRLWLWTALFVFSSAPASSFIYLGLWAGLAMKVMRLQPRFERAVLFSTDRARTPHDGAKAEHARRLQRCSSGGKGSQCDLWSFETSHAGQCCAFRDDAKGAVGHGRLCA